MQNFHVCVPHFELPWGNPIQQGPLECMFRFELLILETAQPNKWDVLNCSCACSTTGAQSWKSSCCDSLSWLLTMSDIFPGEVYDVTLKIMIQKIKTRRDCIAQVVFNSRGETEASLMIAGKKMATAFQDLLASYQQAVKIHPRQVSSAKTSAIKIFNDAMQPALLILWRQQKSSSHQKSHDHHAEHSKDMMIMVWPYCVWLAPSMVFS